MRLKLTLVERIILSNQLRILEIVDSGDADYYRRTPDAVTAGYELEYGELARAMSTDTMNEADSREVVDILNMYRELTFDYGELADKSGIEPRDVQFPGFDGNEEPKELGYVEFLLEQGKWRELQRTGGYNSHSRMLPRYRAMLDAWHRWKSERAAEGTIQRRNLTREEILAITEANEAAARAHR